MIAEVAGQLYMRYSWAVIAEVQLYQLYLRDSWSVLFEVQLVTYSSLDIKTGIETFKNAVLILRLVSRLSRMQS